MANLILYCDVVFVCQNSSMKIEELKRYEDQMLAKGKLADESHFL